MKRWTRTRGARNAAAGGRIAGLTALASLLAAGGLAAIATPANAAPAWSVVASPTPSGASLNGGFNAVSCPTAASCFAVGTYNELGHTKTFGARRTGALWAATPTRNAPVATPESTLEAVSCTSDTFCVAVGSAEGTGVARTLLQHWNGTSWSIVPSPNPAGAVFANLHGVACTAPTNCIAVGRFTVGSVTRPLIERWNGTTWAIQTNPSPAAASSTYLSAVSCATADRCAAVGSSGAGPTSSAFVERWNGTKWLLGSVPARAGATNSRLAGVSCPTTVRCVAIGTSSNAQGTSRTLIYRWNGTDWAINTSPSPAGTSVTTEDVSCATATNCEAVGWSLVAGFVFTPFVERWNGTSWSVATLSPPNDSGALLGVSCPDGTHCDAVGWTSPTAPTSRTWAVGWNGASWTTAATPNAKEPGQSTLADVSCSGPSDCLAVGQRYATKKPLAEHWNGSVWTTVATPSPAGEGRLSGVDCASSTVCFAAGTAYAGSGPTPVLDRWNGSEWSAVTEAIGAGGLNAVSCPTTTSCFAVGWSYTNSMPVVERWNGATWSIVASPALAAADLYGISCPTTAMCVAVGSIVGSGVTKTFIEMYNGSTWSVVSSPNRVGAARHLLQGVSCASTTWCVAVGSSEVDGGVWGPISKTLVVRWNGTSWAIASSVNPAGDRYPVLSGVSCASNASCVAVGSSSPVFVCGCDESSPALGKVALIERWNGSSWSVEPPAKPTGASDYELDGVTCLPGQPCVAVGAWQGTPSSRATRTLVERYA